MSKKLLSVILAFAMILTSFSVAFATESVETVSSEIAEQSDVTESEVQLESEIPTESEVQLEPVSETEVESEEETETSSVESTESVTESETKTETESEIETESEPEIESEAESATESKTESSIESTKEDIKKSDKEKLIKGVNAGLKAIARLAKLVSHNHDDGIVFDNKVTSSTTTLKEGYYYLDQDVTVTEDIIFGYNQSATLCLNGHILNLGNNVLKTGGNLTICDCGTGGQINTYCIYNDGTVTLMSGKIVAVDIGIENYGYGKTYVYGGEISGRQAIYGSTEKNVIEVNGGTLTATSVGIYNFYGTTTFNNGVIISEKEGIAVHNGKLIVNGGKINGETNGITNFNTAIITGGEIYGVSRGIENAYDAVTNIEGGSISGETSITNHLSTIYLSGNPTITGDIEYNVAENYYIYAKDDTGTASYNGNDIKIYLYNLNNDSDGDVIVKNVTDDNKNKFSLSKTEEYGLKQSENNLVLHKHQYSLKFDKDYHWDECLCGYIKAEEEHSSTGINVATYTKKAVCDVCDTEYGDVLPKVLVDKPVADTNEFVYNGMEQTYNVAENEAYTVTGATRTDAGKQDVTISLTNKDKYCWSDNSNDDIIFSFEILKAEPNIVTLPTVSRIIMGETLEDKHISGGEAEGVKGEALLGTFSWAEPKAMDNVGEFTLKINFTPESQNYNLSQIEVEVTVVECDTESGKHEYKWVVDKEPTTSKTGLKHEECACGEKRNENTVTQKLPQKDIQTPATGDNTMTNLWVTVMLLSIFIAVIGISLRKKQNS